MKKAFAWYLAIHLVIFAAAYFVPERSVTADEVKLSAPSSELVLAGRFENLLNHFSGYSNHKVENYTLNSDGTYTVFTYISMVDENGAEQRKQAISRFAVNEENSAGYELIYFDLIDEKVVSYI